jgi:hypothetical protein
VSVRRETLSTGMAGAAGVAAYFDAVVASWAEPVRCQSAYGCRRRASWLAIRHTSCGGNQSVCMLHYRKWMGAVLVGIARSGRMRCTICGETFSTVEECLRFRPL